MQFTLAKERDITKYNLFAIIYLIILFPSSSTYFLFLFFLFINEILICNIMLNWVSIVLGAGKEKRES